MDFYYKITNCQNSELFGFYWVFYSQATRMPSEFFYVLTLRYV